MWKWSANTMIHKPGSQPEATALWFDPQEYDTKQGCKYGGNQGEWGRDRRDEAGRRRKLQGGVGGGVGGVLGPEHMLFVATQHTQKAHIKRDRKEEKLWESVDKVAEVMHTTQAPCPAGDLARGYTAGRSRGHSLSDKKPICMCLSASLSTLPLVNIPVICKQTEFTSDYEWIHQILMENCHVGLPNASPPWYNVHLNTWIANKEALAVCRGNVWLNF